MSVKTRRGFDRKPPRRDRRRWVADEIKDGIFLKFSVRSKTSGVSRIFCRDKSIADRVVAALNSYHPPKP